MARWGRSAGTRPGQALQRNLPARGPRVQLRLPAGTGIAQVQIQVRGRQGAPAALRPFDQDHRVILGQRVQAQPFELAGVGDPVQVQVPRRPRRQPVGFDQAVGGALDPLPYAERPQQGRYRQFYQLDLEAIGSEDPQVDAETIAIASDWYRSLGLTQVRLLLNSLGDKECRPAYRAALQDFLRGLDLDEETRARIENNPLRVLDDKREAVQRQLAGAPLIADHLCEACKAYHEQVRELLTDAGVAFEDDPKLVRGLDYYTRTTFEFVHDGLGSQSAVGGGGRYDGLSEMIGGPALPSVGWALGVGSRMLDELRVLAVNKSGAPRATVDTGHFHAEFAKAEGKYRAARAFAENVWEDCERTLDSGQRLSTEQETLTRLLLNHVTGSIHEVGQTAYKWAGTSALRRGVLQRFFRDLHAGTQHMTSGPVVLQNCGKMLSGLTEGHWAFFDLVEGE